MPWDESLAALTAELEAAVSTNAELGTGSSSRLANLSHVVRAFGQRVCVLCDHVSTIAEEDAVAEEANALQEQQATAVALMSTLKAQTSQELRAKVLAFLFLDIDFVHGAQMSDAGHALLLSVFNDLLRWPTSPDDVGVVPQIDHRAMRVSPRVIRTETIHEEAETSMAPTVCVTTGPSQEALQQLARNYSLLSKEAGERDSYQEGLIFMQMALVCAQEACHHPSVALPSDGAQRVLQILSADKYMSHIFEERVLSKI